MRIGLYGGSFNPFHNGHLLVAAVVLASEDIDELWFVPTFKHMLGKELLPFEHRYEMARRAARIFGGRASVSRVEWRLARRPDFVGSQTIELVRYLQEECPSDRFRLILGSDLLDQFKTWEYAEEIAERAPPIIVSRAGYTSHSALPLRQLTCPDVSSTDVKAALLRGEDVRRLVPREVLAYIEEHRLYQPEK